MRHRTRRPRRRPPDRAKAPEAAAAAPENVVVTGLNRRGEGVAVQPGLRIPFALPGETVSVAAGAGQDRAEPVGIVAPSPHRVSAPCRHFGRCGGCSVQHMAPPFYRDWKRELVAGALAGRGVAAEIGPLVPCPPRSRRRAVFALKRENGRTRLGFYAMRSHALVEIAECHVLVPAIMDALPRLAAIAEAVARGRKPATMTVTATDTGLDVSLSGTPEPAEGERRRALGLALEADLARLSINGETVVTARDPVVHFGAVPVLPPPGGFLQAVAEAEAHMAELVTAHLAGSRRIADLFAGSGAFALRLATSSRVHAVEGDAAALAALKQAAHAAPGLKATGFERRDLFVRPLDVKELKAFDAVVFDPPRVGAEAQCHQIARSGVKRVAAVSCNPVTLARDLAILLEGGFRLSSVTPIDQFLWSAHVEAVALLQRG